MALYSRHPRFTIALFILIFVSVILFANSDSHDSPFSFRRHDALAEALRIEEEYYQKMIVRRHQLIKKWGPTADRIIKYVVCPSPTFDRC